MSIYVAKTPPELYKICYIKSKLIKGRSVPRVRQSRFWITRDFAFSPVFRHFPYPKDFAVFPVSRHFTYSKDFSVLLRREARRLNE